MSSRSSKINKFKSKISTWLLIGFSLAGIVVAILLALDLGVIDKWFQEIVIVLISALLFGTGLDLVHTIAAIKDSVDLSTDTALARKLDSIERKISAIRESIDLSSDSALAAKLDHIVSITSGEKGLRSIGLRFYESRDEANRQSPIATFLQSTNSDLLICALSAYGLINAHGDLFEKLLTKGCNIRLLLPRRSVLEDEDLIKHLALSRDISRTPHHIDDALDFFSKVSLDAQTKSLKGKLEVRSLKFIPTMGFIMIDGDSSLGKIRVEQFVYKSPVADRPSYEVIPTRDGRGLYHFLQKQFELCWNEATKWDPSTDPNIA